MYMYICMYVCICVYVCIYTYRQIVSQLVTTLSFLPNIIINKRVT